MGHYISVNGWFECNYDQLETVRLIIKTSNKEFSHKKIYDECWLFPYGGANWTAYIFFGCDIKSYRMEYFESILSLVCQEIKDIDGFFRIQDDEGIEVYEIFISNGKVERSR